MQKIIDQYEDLLGKYRESLMVEVNHNFGGRTRVKALLNVDNDINRMRNLFLRAVKELIEPTPKTSKSTQKKKKEELSSPS